MGFYEGCYGKNFLFLFSSQSLCYEEAFIGTQLIFTCLKSTLETVEKGVKYVQS